MALVYQKTLNENTWLFSENNNIILFTDDVTTRTILFAEFSFGTETPLRVYADPNGAIYFNVLENVSPRLDNYDDDLDFNTITAANLDTFFLNWSRNYLEYILNIRVVFTNDDELTDTITGNFLLGVEQLIDFHQGITARNKDMLLLSPIKDNSNTHYYMRYWDGYPFDIGYTERLSDGNAFTSLQNLTTGQSLPAFSNANTVGRMVLSNGTTNITIEDFLPLGFGLNVLQFDAQNFVELHKMRSACGKYFKFLNQYGGYSYWLFESYSEAHRTRALGEVNNDFLNIEDTVSPTKSLGRTAGTQLTVFYEDLNADDIKILAQMANSPKIYLYLGERFTPNVGQNWVEVTIPNRNYTIRDFKNKVPNGTIIFNLPEIKTITL